MAAEFGVSSDGSYKESSVSAICVLSDQCIIVSAKQSSKAHAMRPSLRNLSSGLRSCDQTIFAPRLPRLVERFELST